jgi:hypothetical protein
MSLPKNLNELLINDEAAGEALKDNQATSGDHKTTVLFKKLENELVVLTCSPTCPHS